jgi:hypothetical protein
MTCWANRSVMGVAVQQAVVDEVAGRTGITPSRGHPKGIRQPLHLVKGPATRSRLSESSEWLGCGSTRGTADLGNSEPSIARNVQ